MNDRFIILILFMKFNNFTLDKLIKEIFVRVIYKFYKKS